MTRPLLITRPQPQAGEFATLVEAQTAFTPHIAPLQQITDLPATPDFNDVSALAFTSGNGVTTFARRWARRDLPAYCVGDATAALARRLGFQAFSAKGNAAALRAMIAPLPGKVLHLHGAHLAAPVSPHHIAIYDQQAVDLDAATLALLADGRIRHAVVFSPRSAKLLANAWPHPLTAFCISPAAAAPLQGLGPCKIAASPDAAAVLRLLSADK